MAGQVVGSLDAAEQVDTGVVTAKVVSDATIEGVAQDLLNLQREATLDLCVRIGELVINRLYGGDVSVWRKHGPKELSLRKLTERLEGRFSPPVLYRSLAIYELACRMGGISAWKHLGVSHVRPVLGLPPGEQDRILRAAEEEGWTVEVVEQAAAETRRQMETGARRGRRPQATVVKTLRHLERYAHHDGPLLGVLEEVRTLEPHELATLEKTVTTLQDCLHEVLSHLKAAQDGENQPAFPHGDA